MRALLLLALLTGCGRVHFALGAAAVGDAGPDALVDSGEGDASERDPEDGGQDAHFDADFVPEDSGDGAPDAASDSDVGDAGADSDVADAASDAELTTDGDAIGDADAALETDAGTPGPLESGLVVWLPMSTTTATTIPAGPGTTRAATCGGPCPASESVDGRAAIVFDGTYDIQVAYDVGLDFPPPFTFSAYVHGVGGRLRGGIVSRPTASGGIGEAYAFRLEGSGTNPTPSMGRAIGASFSGVNAPAPISTTAWVHIAARYRTDFESMELYVDGVRVNNVGFGSAPGPLPYDGMPLYTPGSAFSGFRFEGAIRDLRIYDRQLTDAELLELAAAR